MSRRLGFLFAFTVSVFMTVVGCSGQRGWEVTVENKGDVPCSFFVTMRKDGSSKANVDNVAKGKVITMIGGSGETMVHTVKVLRGKEEQVLTPDAKLIGGKRYAIVVDAVGKLATSVVDK
ncbi:MAG: hypothetical protein U0941_11170 [Planctomycetaceae bacterium]